jgi:hypothetical protein
MLTAFLTVAALKSRLVFLELMSAENQFWCQRVPGLRPTAGYPVDARRFQAEIAACQQEWGIDSRLLWRKR